jgi:hypothetical protein
MLTIDDQMFLFTASMLLKPEQVATYAPEEARGFVFKLQTDKADVPLVSVESNFKATIDGNLATFLFPFLTGGKTMSADYTIQTDAGLRLGILFAASCVGDFMLVHLHGYRLRQPE